MTLYDLELSAMREVWHWLENREKSLSETEIRYELRLVIDGCIPIYDSQLLEVAVNDPRI